MVPPDITSLASDPHKIDRAKVIGVLAFVIDSSWSMLPGNDTDKDLIQMCFQV
jgi:hypothetical protein